MHAMVLATHLYCSMTGVQSEGTQEDSLERSAKASHQYTNLTVVCVCVHACVRPERSTEAILPESKTRFLRNSEL